MRRVIRQCVRGMQTLPGVGSHPGTSWMLMFFALGALAGAEHGAWGAAIGALVFLFLFGPIYLYGAYERAELSDMIVRDQEPPSDNPTEAP